MAERQALDQTKVEVEASRQEPPIASLNGHTQEVTCVAVTAEAAPRIVSGSEDNTVRVWKRLPAEDRWVEELQLDHKVPVRSLAVTGPKTKAAVMLTGTVTGRARLFTLADMKELMLESRHTGAINACAFSPEGDLCVTAGEDASLCLWKVETGKLMGRVATAHRAAITSVVFTPGERVVTAGRDKRIVVWKLTEGGEGGRTLKEEGAIDRRGGDVTSLGTDPEGTHVLFDDGRELSVRSLDGRLVTGTLRNPPGSPNFAQFAMFSPDGKTILAAGNGPGRLQLWRAPGEGARPAELRQYLWSAAISCGAFAPEGKFAATGTADNRVLVWQLPESGEAEKPLKGQLTFVEEFLDTNLRKLTIRATVENPDGWVIPGATATIVVPPLR
jgi:WD40 repeat protein